MIRGRFTVPSAPVPIPQCCSHLGQSDYRITVGYRGEYYTDILTVRHIIFAI